MPSDGDGGSMRGRGHLRLLLAYAFRTLGMARLQAFAHPHNPASAKVLDRLGFHREGLLRDYRPSEQGREDRTSRFTAWPNDS